MLIDCSSLAGKILCALPHPVPHSFTEAVIVILTHTDQGASGFIINRKFSNISLYNVLKNKNITLFQGKKITSFSRTRVFLGGNAHVSEPFILHSPHLPWAEKSVLLPDGYGISQDIGHVPAENIKYRVFLGQMVWSAGALEKMVAEPFWAVIPWNTDLLFKPCEKQWMRALTLCGIKNPILFSPHMVHTI